MSDKMRYGSRNPDFSRSGRFDGSIPASRWLARLAFDFKRMDDETSPEEFLEAVEILLDGDAAMWLDSSKIFRDMVDNRHEATENDVDIFKEALIAEFPIRVVERTEGNVQQEIRMFKQLSEEPLLTYYGRAKHLLRRAHGRDEPVQSASGMLVNPLSPLEKMMLSGIISTFVEGLCDAELRSLAIRKSVMCCSSLYNAYQIIQDTKLGMETEREVEARLAREKEYSDLKALVFQQFGKPSSAVLAEFNSGSRVTRSKAPLQAERAGIQISSIPTNHAFQTGTGSAEYRGDDVHVRGELHFPKPKQGPVSSSARPPESVSHLPPNTFSKNSFVNGSRNYRRDQDGQLCIRCGTIGHVGYNCSGHRLENWEQVYLRNLIFHNIQPGGGAPMESKSTEVLHENCQGSWSWNNENFNAPVEKRDVRVAGQLHKEENGKVQQFSLEQFSGKGLGEGKDSYKTLQGNSVFLGNESGGIPTVTLESYLGEQARKRQRVEVEDIINNDEAGPARRAQRRSRIRKGQPLAEIVGRQGKGPLNYTKLAGDMIVQVSLLDLYQMSPDLTRAFRKLSTRVSKRTSKSKSKVSTEGLPEGEVLLAGESEDVDIKRRDLKTMTPLIAADRKAFRIPVIVRTSRGGKPANVALPTEVSQADQGSDMIVITIGLVRSLGIPVQPLAERGYHNLTMNVADGRAAKLTHCCTLTIGVLGIWRTVEAFVRPFDKGNETDLHLLLGMPWLHSVDAKIFIRASKIELGDVKRGEDIKELKGPQFTESTHNKLILRPKLGLGEEEEEDSSSCSSDSELEEDSSSDEDDFDEIVGTRADKGKKSVRFEGQSEN
ncbi:hypothetical protein OnM2_051053 [Erysiphe neolycopersici]|uniref:CCHC-type domain-containing protein n=1 Tax=Erysiphe neolycopersici TaxID=212602 RepID=A0A420HSP3_9PEZI|nr:hypothetical protein OnM2_051053 [Erysiphe neolycopersici]